MNAFRRGIQSLADRLADIISFGAISAERARDTAGRNDPRPGHVKDAEALRDDWRGSPYYRPEDPEEIKRNRAMMDRFLDDLSG